MQLRANEMLINEVFKAQITESIEYQLNSAAGISTILNDAEFNLNRAVGISSNS